MVVIIAFAGAPPARVKRERQISGESNPAEVKRRQVSTFLRRLFFLALICLLTFQLSAESVQQKVQETLNSVEGLKITQSGLEKQLALIDAKIARKTEYVRLSQASL